MNDDKKETIKIQFRDMVYSKDVDVKEAFVIIDSLSGREPAILTDASSNYIEYLKTHPEASLSKVPERSLLTQFIKSQPEYKFTIDDIIKHFLRKDSSEFKSKEEMNYLNAIRAKVIRIRQEIEQLENGKWIEEYRNHQKVFKFVKTTKKEV